MWKAGGGVDGWQPGCFGAVPWVDGGCRLGAEHLCHSSGKKLTGWWVGGCVSEVWQVMGARRGWSTWVLGDLDDTAPPPPPPACTLHPHPAAEEVKLAAVGALEAWLPRCSPLPAVALERLREGLKEKEALRRCVWGARGGGEHEGVGGHGGTCGMRGRGAPAIVIVFHWGSLCLQTSAHRLAAW